MKRNILRAAITASIFGLSGTAFAESVDVPFSGTVVNGCTITKDADGVLVRDPTYPDYVDSNPENGGTRGKVTVSCSGSAMLDDQGAVKIAIPAGMVDVSINAYLYDVATGGVVINPTGPIAIPAGVRSYYPHVSAQFTTVAAPGLYSYKTTITVTPD